MEDIAKVVLENEMDLIIAHKRSMKLAELLGLSLSAQTSFATAVSEVARNTIENGKSGYLVLGVDGNKVNKQIQFIVASIKNGKNSGTNLNGLEYAKKLVNKFSVSTNKNSETLVELFYAIPPHIKIDMSQRDEWRTIFRNEPAFSPYEEIRRQNERLQELSAQLQKSEAQYKMLTNSLPLMIFSLNTAGLVVYANEWLQRYTGETIESLNTDKWKQIVHPSDYDAFILFFNNKIPQEAASIKMQARIKQKDNDDHLWHQVSLSPFLNDRSELQYWIGYLVDIHAQKIYEETLKDNFELKQVQEELSEHQEQLEKYIVELNQSNFELQQFAFVASHDLQEPVRKLMFYSDYLLKRYDDKMDGKGIEYLKLIHSVSGRMRTLIKDLLAFSQISKTEIAFNHVDLNSVARYALQDLQLAIEEKKAVINIQSLPSVEGDESLLRQLFENIITNSLKYSRNGVPPEINISCKQVENNHEIIFADNGIGFEEKYAPQIFKLFQRLHARDQYEGTGLGLAICLKIVEIHKGSIRATSSEGKGANFFVSLPIRTV
ncbi:MULTISPECIES: ATP-binding protein [Niastella]|uniref:histidine kinase n=1 Tax=Niastella soli TaxID=2821487 RepID=A0ABS3Z4A2_9BACT|nr:ATP-binding protein [Niastella soli]MBO9204567.1 PAS domain S-box protein [Niastella soli]